MSIKTQKISVQLYRAENEKPLERPLIGTNISAGFPSPALDFISQGIDLNKHLILG